MDVIGTGFGRTGTLSVKKALELLGFGPCHHMMEAMQRPGQFRHLAAHVRGEPVDWDQLFGRYGSQVDFPGAVIWRELLDAYPDAKVLHTVRDSDRWYDSTAETIYPLRNAIAPWVRRLVPPVAQALEVNDAMIWDGLFEGRFEDRDRAIEIFEARTAEVIETVPPDRLLVFNVADGWEPLCGFLDVPIPDVAFPHLNDRRMMTYRLHGMRAVTHATPWVAAVAGVGLIRRSQQARRSD